MRNTFVRTLHELASKDKRILLLTADLGFSVFEEFMETLPSQYFNMGIAEQNMAGVAAGLAMEGYIPVIYSIVPFATMRNFEQIRNDIAYQKLNVKIVGVGAGFAYGPYGHTHHGIEDIAVMRSIPEMTVIAPGDPVETKLATIAMMSYVGAVYLRLGKTGEPVLHRHEPDFSIGKAIILSKGTDITLVGTSTMLDTTMKVCTKLQADGVSVRVLSMHTVKPIDTHAIRESIDRTGVIVTIEEHGKIGGLGSAVSEVIAEYGKPSKFMRFAIPDHFTKVIGNQEYMRHANGLSVDDIYTAVNKYLRGNK